MSASALKEVLPSPLEHKVIHYYHHLNHLDIWSTRKLIRTRFLFKHMNTKIIDFVYSCSNCQCAKTTRHVVLLIAFIPMPNKRFKLVNIDIAGPFPSSHGNFFILICVDPFTRWIEAFPMPNQTTLSVIHAFKYHVQYFGCPTEIHSDAGCQFTSTTFKEYCEFLGSSHRIKQCEISSFKWTGRKSYQINQNCVNCKNEHCCLGIPSVFHHFVSQYHVQRRP